MTDLTGLELFPLIYLMLVTLLAGIVRGYSGFGFSALVVLLGSWILPPVQIVPLILLLEIIASIHLLPSIWSSIDWVKLRRLIIGSAFSIPFGVYALAYLDENWMRILISLMIFTASISILMGVSFKRYDGHKLDYSLGVVSGFMTGVAAIGGLAVAVVFLSIQLPIAVLRAIVIALFFATDLYSTLIGLGHGLLTSEILVLCLLLFPLLFIGVVIGKRKFSKANEATFRRLTLILLVTLSITGLIKPIINMTAG